MMNASKASETIPNLDATFSSLLYKFCDDGPASDIAQLFCCMSFVHAGVTHKNLSVPFYAGQMTKEDIMVFMGLSKIKGNKYGAMHAMRLLLHKYITMKDRDGWDNFAEDVEFVGPVDELPLCWFE
jgi:hypothetical protein